MGKRSRKRGEGARRLPEDEPAVEADVRPRGRPLSTKARREEAPQAPWGAFPLGELATLAGLVLCVVGFFTTSAVLLIVGIVLVAVFAIELSTREHFNGYKSHTSLLAGMTGLALGAVVVVVGAPRVAGLAVGVAVAAAAFVLLRKQFKERTGGLGFRA